MVVVVREARERVDVAVGVVALEAGVEPEDLRDAEASCRMRLEVAPRRAPGFASGDSRHCRVVSATARAVHLDRAAFDHEARCRYAVAAEQARDEPRDLVVRVARVFLPQPLKSQLRSRSRPPLRDEDRAAVAQPDVVVAVVVEADIDAPAAARGRPARLVVADEQAHGLVARDRAPRTPRTRGAPARARRSTARRRRATPSRCRRAAPIRPASEAALAGGRIRYHRQPTNVPRTARSPNRCLRPRRSSAGSPRSRGNSVPTAAARKRALLDALGARPLATARQVRALPRAAVPLARVSGRRGGARGRSERVLAVRGAGRTSAVIVRRSRTRASPAPTSSIPSARPRRSGWRRRCPTRITIAWDRVDDTGRLGRPPAAAARGPPKCPGYDEPPDRRCRGVDAAPGRPGTPMPRSSSRDGRARGRHARARLDCTTSWICPIRVAAGAGTPRRTGARWAQRRVRVQPAPLDHCPAGPPPRGIRARPRVREVPPAGRRAADRTSRTRRWSRASATSTPSPAPIRRDVRIVEWEHGLQFACIGVRPGAPVPARGRVRVSHPAERRADRLRARERALRVVGDRLQRLRDVPRAARRRTSTRVCSRRCATLFGSDTFAIYPYQLGHENDEGLQSGAWWFYYKLGFRPREPSIAPLVGPRARRVLAARALPHAAGDAEAARGATRVPVARARARRRDRRAAARARGARGHGLPGGAIRATIGGAAPNVVLMKSRHPPGSPRWRRRPAGERMLGCGGRRSYRLSRRSTRGACGSRAVGHGHSRQRQPARARRRGAAHRSPSVAAGVAALGRSRTAYGTRRTAHGHGAGHKYANAQSAPRTLRPHPLSAPSVRTFRPHLPSAPSSAPSVRTLRPHLSSAPSVRTFRRPSSAPSVRTRAFHAIMQRVRCRSDLASRIQPRQACRTCDRRLSFHHRTHHRSWTRDTSAALGRARGDGHPLRRHVLARRLGVHARRGRQLPRHGARRPAPRPRPRRVHDDRHVGRRRLRERHRRADLQRRAAASCRRRGATRSA